jgi:hypothetical protein
MGTHPSVPQVRVGHHHSRHFHYQHRWGDGWAVWRGLALHRWEGWGLGLPRAVTLMTLAAT